MSATERIRNTFISNLDANTWMDDKTSSNAKTKVYIETSLLATQGLRRRLDFTIHSLKTFSDPALRLSTRLMMLIMVVVMLVVMMMIMVRL